MVGVPTGIKIFNWIGTMYGGQDPTSKRARCSSASAFVFQFILAGLTGIMLAATPFDWQLTDTYFVVAHFHYRPHRRSRLHHLRRLSITGSRRSPALMLQRNGFGKLHFWLFLIGFQTHLHHHAYPGPAGNASTHLYLSRGSHAGRSGTKSPRLGVIFPGRGRDPLLPRGHHPGVCAAARKPPAPDPWNAWTLEWSTTFPTAGIQLRGDHRKCIAAGRYGTSSIPEDPDWKYE